MASWSALPLMLACVLLTSGAPQAAGRTVSFRAEDGTPLAATWYEASPRPAPTVILVHMLHRSRRDWDAAAQQLADEGIAALAVDLRGHGESGGAPGADAYDRMVLDVKAARRYLANRNDVAASRVGIVGASLGANLAVLATAADPSIASLALLSPSLDYRGLRIETALRKLTGCEVLLVASDDDPYAVRSSRELQKSGGGLRELMMLSRAGHGTAMLARDSGLARVLVDWFRRTL